MNDLQEIRVTLESRFPILCIESHEELRALAMLQRLAGEMRQRCFTWSVADGLACVNFSYGSTAKRSYSLFATVDEYEPTASSEEAADRVRPIENTTELQAALHHIDKEGEAGIYILLDPNPWMEQAAVVRLMREIALQHKDKGCTLVLIAPRLELPQELARHAANRQLALPDAKRIRELFKEEIELYARSPEGRRVEGDQLTAEQLILSLSGLCEEDVRRLLRMAIRDDGAITRDDIRRVGKAKQDMLGGTALEIEFPDGGDDKIGGMPSLKRWLRQRQKAFTQPVQGLPTPKGVLLLGVQGGGKSLAARTVAGTWGVPLARLDIGALFNKYHGETERNLRDALKAAEALAPCVLWIDEIEKALGGDDDSASDGGLARRLLGALLTWMAEHESRIFIAATANDVRQLPPELMRKGRLDEIFFVDLPNPEVRQEIFDIHFKAKKLDAARFDLAALASVSEGFSGAEIEQAVISALYESQYSGEPANQALLVKEIKRTRPLSVVMAERIAELRAWAQQRAVFA